MSNKPPCRPEYTYKNGTKNRWFPALVDLKTIEDAVFDSKVLIKILSQDIF